MPVPRRRRVVRGPVRRRAGGGADVEEDGERVGRRGGPGGTRDDRVGEDERQRREKGQCPAAPVPCLPEPSAHRVPHHLPALEGYGVGPSRASSRGACGQCLRLRLRRCASCRGLASSPPSQSSPPRRRHRSRRPVVSVPAGLSAWSPSRFRAGRHRGPTGRARRPGNPPQISNRDTTAPPMVTVPVDGGGALPMQTPANPVVLSIRAWVTVTSAPPTDGPDADAPALQMGPEAEEAGARHRAGGAVQRDVPGGEEDVADHRDGGPRLLPQPAVFAVLEEEFPRSGEVRSGRVDLMAPAPSSTLPPTPPERRRARIGKTTSPFVRTTPDVPVGAAEQGLREQGVGRHRPIAGKDEGRDGAIVEVRSRLTVGKEDDVGRRPVGRRRLHEQFDDAARPDRDLPVEGVAVRQAALGLTGERDRIRAGQIDQPGLAVPNAAGACGAEQRSRSRSGLNRM